MFLTICFYLSQLENHIQSTSQRISSQHRNENLESGDNNEIRFELRPRNNALNRFSSPNSTFQIPLRRS